MYKLRKFPRQLGLETMVQLKHTGEKAELGGWKEPGDVFCHFPMGQFRTQQYRPHLDLPLFVYEAKHFYWFISHTLKPK